jgi:hypothetical protein
MRITPSRSLCEPPAEERREVTFHMKARETAIRL